MKRDGDNNVSQYPGMEEVLALLRTGEWELGYFSGTRSDGSYKVQRGGLSRGGETRTVKIGTIRALERRKLIAAVPREPGQPYWRRHYRLTEQAMTTHDN